MFLNKLHLPFFLILFVAVSCSKPAAMMNVESAKNEKQLAGETASVNDYYSRFKHCDAYVSSSGKDSNEGSFEKPFKTPGKAITSHKSGGVIAIGGIAVGDGNTLIQGNTISGVEGGMGIRIYKSFPNPKFRKVRIKDNVIITGGSGEGIAINNDDHGHPGLAADVDLIKQLPPPSAPHKSPD